MTFATWPQLVVTSSEIAIKDHDPLDKTSRNPDRTQKPESGGYSGYAIATASYQ